MASRYFIDGLVDLNWSSITNWSLTDGGVGGQAVPTASDDVFFTANSPACTVNTSARVALTLNFTGYTNTITMSQQISVSGSVTLVSAMTIAGSGALLVIATGTLTANGKTWPNAMTLNGGPATNTLADAWNVDGLLTIGAGSSTTTINGFTINAGAGLMVPSSAISTGTTVIVMDGTGTIACNNTTSFLKNSLTINTAGTITIGTTNAFRYDTGTLTYTAGTVVTTGSTLRCQASTTLACNGMTWNAFQFIGSGTLTLNENLNVSGLFTVGSSTTTHTINGSDINAAGGMTHSSSSGTVVGTSSINFTGTGTVTSSGLSSGRILTSININAPSGTITFVTPFQCDLAVLTYTAGTVITESTWASGGGGGGAATLINGGLVG